ncbi:MAG: 2,3-bisphosphoglycerate-independent phosphoglycerate mutase [bacterium]|nr:2,3-bisphosphoglycerate-independent phosphoglycerate mutase [bacterium]
MLDKVVFVVMDGLGDRPIPELSGDTPLEAAHTPNIDKLASASQCGSMCALGRGKKPGSDTSHLAIMGYDPTVYHSGRGPIEVAGIGIELQGGDIALRGNLGTVDHNWIIKDRRAGRIRDVQPFTEALDGLRIEDVEFIVKPGTAHRAGVVLRGRDLSDAVTDADPHELDLPVRRVDPTEKNPEAERTAEVLNSFHLKSHEILTDHPHNRRRTDQGLLPANFLLLRGAGTYRELPSFQERYGLSACCIAGGGLYKGIGAILGMKVIDVPGATGLPDTDVEAKFQTAVTKLPDFDFIFVHVKAADSLAEDGNYDGKKSFIEKIDRASRLFLDLPPDVLLVMTADHSTPCGLRQHSADPVPILFCGHGVRKDNVTTFGERACATGGLGLITGLDVMPEVENLLGRLPLIGA